MKKIIYFLMAAVVMALASCTDYDGSKQDIMPPANIQFVSTTTTISEFYLGGDINEIVDCYLEYTDFTGNKKEVKISNEPISIPTFTSSDVSGENIIKVRLQRNNQAITKAKYKYEYCPGKVDWVMNIKTAEGNDSTFTYNETFTTEFASLSAADGKQVTEEEVKTWMQTMYDLGNKATFKYFKNEMGWPVAFVKDDYVVEYDF